MEKHTGYVNDRAGNAVDGASVRVLNANGTLAQLFASNSGVASSNPVYTNGDGRYAFAAANGRYLVEISYAGTVYASQDIVLYDEADDNTATQEQLTALTSSLGADDGATLVGAKQAGTGAVPRTVRDKLRDTFSIKDFGAAGDGVTDDTAAIQAAINALPAGGHLTGLGLTCVVQSLHLKSNMRLSSVNLVTKANSPAMTSPITIDGTGTPKIGIHLTDVHVDGNRVNQSYVVPGAEDGGMHCFRLVGDVEDVVIERCTGNNSAGDGIELFSSSAAGATDATFTFRNIVLRDCEFHWNRRHGMSADAVQGLRMYNVELHWNGLDLNTTDSLDAGTRGARSGGSLYGNGIDFEGYGLGSSFNDLNLSNVRGLYNARGGCLFYDAVATRGAGFVARSKIWISDCYFDHGQDVSRTGEALTFTSTIESKALGALYDSVYIQNTRLDGHLLARCVNNLYFNGEARGAAYYAVLDYATAVRLDVTAIGALTAYSENSTFSEGRERVSVKQFGAVGNGTTDDTAAIQAAATYAVSSGMTLHFPRATYKLMGKITVRAEGMVIDGGNSKILLGANTAGFAIAGVGNHIKAFRFQQTAQTLTPTAIEIFNDATTPLSIHNRVTECYGSDVYRGILGNMPLNGDGKACYRTQVSDCEFINKYLQKTWAGSFGIGFDGPNSGDAGGNDSRVTGCTAAGYQRNFVVNNSVATQFTNCSGDGGASCFSYEGGSSGMQVIGGYYEYNDVFIAVAGTIKYDLYLLYPSYANNTAFMSGAGVSFISGGWAVGQAGPAISNGGFTTNIPSGTAEIFANNGLQVFSSNGKTLRMTLDSNGDWLFENGRVLCKAGSGVYSNLIESYTGGATPLDLRAAQIITLTTDSTERLRIAADGSMVHRNNGTVIVDAGSAIGLRGYTVATLPSASPAARMIYVSDGTANKRLAVSDGTNWRWPDGAIVS